MSKEKIITIKVDGAAQGQWSSLLLELNLMKQAWKSYGVDINTKEKFTESMLTQHCISHTFTLDIERLR